MLTLFQGGLALPVTKVRVLAGDASLLKVTLSMYIKPVTKTYPTLRNVLTHTAVCMGIGLAFCPPLMSQTLDIAKLDQQKSNLAGPAQRVVEETYTQDRLNARIVMTETYDRNGYVTEREVALIYKDAPEKDAKSRSVLVRSSSSRITEERTYRNDGSLLSRQMYSYDANGNLANKVSYRSDNFEMNKWVYAHDSHGNKTEEKYFDAGSLKTRFTYEYDERGNVIKSVSYKEDGSVEYSGMYKYDDKNRRTEIVIDGPTGLGDRRRVYRYNEKGHLSEEILYASNKSVEDRKVYVYEFDQKGNWVKRTTSIWTMNSGKLQPESNQITQRTISYYSER
jgi:antitoxin component YwqK of YwqJK toxin-antitoxin module